MIVSRDSTINSVLTLAACSGRQCEDPGCRILSKELSDDREITTCVFDDISSWTAHGRHHRHDVYLYRKSAKRQGGRIGVHPRIKFWVPCCQEHARAGGGKSDEGHAGCATRGLGRIHTCK